MAPLLSWHTAASPAGVRARLSAAGGFQGLRESSQDKWSELCPCTGCPSQITAQGGHRHGKGLVTSLAVSSQSVPVCAFC